MFLLVSVRLVGAHPGEHQHGVSMQISISLGKTFLRICRMRNIPLTWILARVFVYVPPFISQILDFINWTVLIFILIYFEWRDTENQQYRLRKRLGIIKIQIIYTCSPVVLTEVEGRICGQIRCICVSNFQDIFQSAPLVGEWTGSNYHHNVCGREAGGRRRRYTITEIEFFSLWE